MKIWYIYSFKIIEYNNILIRYVIDNFKWLWLKEIIPKDAFKICSGRLFISVTILTLLGPKNIIYSEFTSNQDLFECCLASSSIPYLTERQGLRKYREYWVVDGGVTNNTPVFTDELRRQMVSRKQF
jgi:predicted acylesterase/phospholipase RssA